MNNIVYVGLSPHPPVIIPTIGKEELTKVEATVTGMKKWADEVRRAEPDTIVLISPHGTVFSDAITIRKGERVQGNLADFGAPQVKADWPVDVNLLEAIGLMAYREQVNVVSLDREEMQRLGAKWELDHGAIVPLWYLQEAGLDCALVSVNMGLLAVEELYAFGLAVQRAAGLLGRKVAVIASGDLSHRLTPDAPSGFAPEGKEFDRRIKENLELLQIEEILRLPEELVEKAGECGLRPLIMALGALDGLDAQCEIFSYEGPFGVGYLVCGFKPQGPNPERELLEKLIDRREEEIAARRARESYPVKLARRSLEYYLRNGEILDKPKDLPPELEKAAGVFVSIKKHGQLRGCIGTTEPTQPTIAEEIIHNAIAAGTRDPRFWPVEEEELSQLLYSVDILNPAERVNSLSDLDPRQYGVIVRKGRSSGLLLPDLPGVDTVEEQLRIAKQKAGINPMDQDVEIWRFTVTRYL
ncbi:MAG: AmmeMemoRadiSam system protein A [Bacillota bacterium]